MTYQDVSEWSAYFVFESNLSLNRQTHKNRLCKVIFSWLKHVEVASLGNILYKNKSISTCLLLNVYLYLIISLYRKSFNLFTWHALVNVSCVYTA